MNNRFFTYDDECINELIFPLEPKFWWSRLYEYLWVMQFIKEDSCVLDACAGTYHPFKFAIADKCKEVYACDAEDISYNNINNATIKRFGKSLDKELYNKIKLSNCNITSLPYSDEKFDVITCISALEHMKENIILDGLKEIKRVLKNNGLAVITLDYPTITPDKFMELVKESGLEIDGEYDYQIPKNAITTTYFGGRLYCYSMILRKPKTKGRPKKSK